MTMKREQDQIVHRSGGWFVTGESWSGPWTTKEAADLARDGEYSLAHEAERQASREPTS